MRGRRPSTSEVTRTSADNLVAFPFAALGMRVLPSLHIPYGLSFTWRMANDYCKCTEFCDDISTLNVLDFLAFFGSIWVSLCYIILYHFIFPLRFSAIYENNITNFYTHISIYFLCLIIYTERDGSSMYKCDYVHVHRLINI